MSALRKAIVAIVGLAIVLSVPLVFSTPAAAAENVNITLYGSRAGGWGYTNTSLSIPGPPLAVHVGDNVTLVLTAVDNRNHNWFIDYNNNSAVNAGEPSSPNFGTGGLPGGSWNFTVSNRTGTFLYRSRTDATTMWGSITIMNATAGGLFGVDNTVLIVVGVVIIIIAVLAVATMYMRRSKKPPAEPPPPR